MNILGTSMFQVLGLSLGLGLMAPACSSESMERDSGYYPTLDGGAGGDGNVPDIPHDGGHGSGGDAGSPPIFIERVSVNNDGIEANGPCQSPWISGDGRHIAFPSEASNLDPTDTNNAQDIFVRDRAMGITQRINAAGLGAFGHSTASFIDVSGRYVTFSSRASNISPIFAGVYVHDRNTLITHLVSVREDGSPADGSNASGTAPIDATGRYVAFAWNPDGLVSRDPTTVRDVYFRDLLLGVTELVSIDPAPSSLYRRQSPLMDNSGRFIAFVEGSPAPDVSWKIFLKDRVENTTSLVASGDSVYSTSGSFFISGNGRYIAYNAQSSDDVSSIYMWDRESNSTELIGPGTTPSIDAEGRFIAYFRAGRIYVRDRQSGATRLISVNSNGVEGNSPYYSRPFISSDGRFVTFSSQADNLVPDDTNSTADIFVVGIENLFDP